MMNNTNRVTTRAGQYFCLTVLLFSFFSWFAAAIWDSDFWWHIAAGQWISDNTDLPESDPFQVFPANDRIRSDTVLTGQWLGQLVLYTAYSALDAWGVILLRAGILVVCLFLLFQRSRSLGASLFASWLMTGLAGLIALGFTSDRPQLFSYLFAVLCFVLLERYEQEHKLRWLLPLPLFAVIWANTHGGFLLMAAVLFVFAGLNLLQSFARAGRPDAASIMLLVAFVSFMLATLVSPNGITTYLYLFDLEGSQLQAMTSEYRSPFSLYELGYVLPQVWVLLIYAAAVAAIPGLFRAPPFRLVIMLVLAVFSMIAYRYFAFFVLLAGPYIAQGLTLALRERVLFQGKMAGFVNKYTGIAVMLMSFAFLGYGYGRGELFRQTINSDMFPVAAVEHMKKFDLSGRVFNHMQWGGYLLWQTWPQVRVYIDGRMLDESKIPPYTNMLWATPPGIDVFNKEQFDLVLMPKTNRFTGEEYQLNHYLLTRPDWMLVYQDSQTYLFQKQNRDQTP